MNLTSTLQRCLPLVSLQTTAEIDAEIREELEFHLHMQTQNNISAGMAPEQAHQKALQRFGDFEAQRQACRKITLGPRLMLHRMQAGLLIVLLGTVIYQAVLLFNLQISSRDRIESLTQLVQQLQADQKNTESATTIPFVKWEFEPADSATTTEDITNIKASQWTTSLLEQPWSNWSALDIQTQQNQTPTTAAPGH